MERKRQDDQGLLFGFPDESWLDPEYVSQTTVQISLDTEDNWKFDILGFIEETSDQECTLRPPVIDKNTLQSKQNLRKLLRAWVEIHAWLAAFKRLHGDNYHRPFNILY